MRLRTVIRIAIISSIVLFCTGFIMFSFFRLSAAENEEECNLYSLIPEDASAVFETSDIVRLVQTIDEMDCSKDNHYLLISRLFATFKSYLNTLLDDTPHGLSKQMNKMIFSFHEPDNEWNQVLYCSLGSGDYQLLEKFVGRLDTGAYPSRLFEYRGQNIRIYPLPDGSFMSCYVTSRFLVLSYQKRLVEQVVDAYLSKKSLMNDPFFEDIHDSKKKAGMATVYTRMYSVNMGKGNGKAQVHTNLGNWTEFDMKMNGTAIYFSGISHDSDTCHTFMSMLRKQEPVKGFPDRILPASTFFFSRRSVSDLESMLSFTAGQEYSDANYSDYIKQRDEELSAYLKEHGNSNITTCLFRKAEDSLGTAAVMSIPLYDMVQAERALLRLLETTPVEPGVPRVPLKSLHQKASKTYSFYVLPRNTLFTQLTGITNVTLNGHACFYGGHLLVAPDASSLAQYIGDMESGEFMDDTAIYKDGISGLSDNYHFMLVADLHDMMAQPDTYTRLIPSLFFRNPNFFRYFTLSAQFLCNDGVVYPNIVLFYKGE